MAITEVIKYEGDNNTFAWKHPSTDFNTTTQLIVHESQEAIFFMNGQALDLFGAGKYTLETQNIPLVKKLLNLPTEGNTPFHCEVYFINKTMPLDIKWGTNSQIHVLDPKFNILLHVGANGGMGVQIEDSRKFLIKFIGTQSNFSKEMLSLYFREMITTRVKTHLANIMSQVSFVTVNAHLDEISGAMESVISNDMKEFGVKLIKFIVSAIQLSERDYKQVQDALAIASSVGIAAQAEKGRMETLGYNWADQERAEIAKKFAENPGSANNVGGMMAQLPMAFAFGQMMKSTATPIMSEMFSQSGASFSNNNPTGKNNIFCSGCGKKSETRTAFCSFCGKQIILNNDCKKCGNALKDSENFCPKCGSKREVIR